MDWWVNNMLFCINHTILLFSGAATALGCVFGCLVGGAISERIGKNLVVFSCNLVLMVLWITISFAKISWLIILVRLLMGIFCSGAYSCVGEGYFGISRLKRMFE